MSDTSRRGRLRVGIYARQSHGCSTSVEEQVTIGRADTDVEGHEVVAVYRDRRPASRRAKRREARAARKAAAESSDAAEQGDSDA